MFYTAQCDAVTMICGAISATPEPLAAPDGKYFVALDSYDPSVIGKRWDTVNQKWVTP